MTKYTTPRDAIYKIFIGNPGPCPQCRGVLKKSYQSYLVLTHTGKCMKDSFTIGGDFGWFCQSCPVVVLDKRTGQNDEILHAGLEGWRRDYRGGTR